MIPVEVNLHENLTYKERYNMPTGTMNYAPLTISFTNTSKGDGLKYNWDFGDGVTSVKPNPTHTFNEGAHTVTLTVTNANGSSTTTSQIVALPTAKEKELKVEKDGKDDKSPLFDIDKSNITGKNGNNKDENSKGGNNNKSGNNNKGNNSKGDVELEK